MNTLRSILLVALLSILGTSNAEITIALHRQALRDGGRNAELEQTYVSGVGRGLWIANYQGRFFCPPDQFIAQSANFLQWLDKETEENPKVKPDSLIELVLFGAMMKIFPCAKQ